MSEPQWYVVGGDGQKAGPYTERQVREYLASGQVTTATTLWKEGMSGWEPLSQVDPFATDLRRAAAAKRGKVLKIVGLSGGAALLIAVGLILYFVLREPPEIGEARSLVAGGHYAKATLKLMRYVRKHPDDLRAVRVLAEARVNEYAVGKSVGAESLNELFSGEGGWLRSLGNLAAMMRDPLAHATELYKKWLSAESGAAGTVRGQIDAAMGRVPPAQSARIQRLAQMQLDLGVAERGAMIERLLALTEQAGERGAANLLDGVARLAKEWKPQDAGAKHAVAQRCLACARAWEAGDPAAAQKALAIATQLEPEAAESEAALWMQIRLDRFGRQDHWTRCERYLSKFPDAANRPDVLMAVAARGKSIGIYSMVSRGALHPAVARAAECARELIEKHPQAAGVEKTSLELARHLGRHDVAREQQAVPLLRTMITRLKGSANRDQMVKLWYQWRRLSPELDALSAKADAALKVEPLTTPGFVNMLAADPGKCRVLQVDPRCTADKFSTQEADQLRAWVRSGGILWAGNDVFSLFNVKVTTGYIREMTCQPGVSPEVCPAVKGVTRVALFRGKCAYGLSGEGAMTLLADAGKAYWSIVPYGQGVVCDIKPIDQSKHDGARFWLNYRLYCLGWEIPDPGATGVPVGPAGPVVPPQDDARARQMLASLLKEAERLERGGDLDAALKKFLWIRDNYTKPALYPAGYDIAATVRKIEAATAAVAEERRRCAAEIASASALEAAQPERALTAYEAIRRTFANPAVFPAGFDLDAKINELNRSIRQRKQVADALAEAERIERGGTLSDRIKAHGKYVEIRRAYTDQSAYPAGVRIADRIDAARREIERLVKADVAAALRLAADGSRTGIQSAIAKLKAIASGEARPFLPAGTDINAEVARLTKQLEVTGVATAAQLAEALREKDKLEILWVRLKLADCPRDTRQALKDWAGQGGVLWLDTDLARDFGFGRMPAAADDEQRGKAEVANVDHAITRGIKGQEVGYLLSDDRLTIEGTARNLRQYGVTALLGWKLTGRIKGVAVVCALRTEGKGLIVYRPSEIDTGTHAGRTLDENLRKFCLDHGR